MTDIIERKETVAKQKISADSCRTNISYILMSWKTKDTGENKITLSKEFKSTENVWIFASCV